MQFQTTLCEKRVTIIAEALEFYSRFMWGQIDHLPLSLEAAPRMKEVYTDQVQGAAHLPAAAAALVTRAAARGGVGRGSDGADGSRPPGG